MADVAVPEAVQQVTEESWFAGKRRWRFSPDPAFYTFEDFKAFCEKEQFTRYDPEAQKRTTHAGAVYLWRMGFNPDQEEKTAKRRREALDQCEPLPFEAFMAGCTVPALLRAVTPPPQLCGPSGAGCCLRLSKTGNTDCWGGDGSRAALQLEVVEGPPNVIVRIRCFSGMLLRANTEKPGKVTFSSLDEDDELTHFELLQRKSEDHMTTLVSLMPKKGATAVGLFALYEPPPESMADHVDKVLPEDSMARISQLGHKLMQVQPELQGRRRHRQDTTKTYYNFQEMLCWAARNAHLTKEDDARELGEAIWKFLCVKEEDDACQRASKRCRGAAGGWQLVQPGAEAQDSTEMQM